MISRFICALGVVLAAGVVLSVPAGAVEYDWTGGATPNTLWTNPGNWSPVGYPGQAPGDTARFGGDASVIPNIADLGTATLTIDRLLFAPGITGGGFTVADTDPLGGALVLGVLEQQSGDNIISASLQDSGSFSATASGGSLQLGDGNVEFNITITDPNGSLRIQDTALVTIQGDLPNLEPQLSAANPADQLFPGGIVLERGGGLWLRYFQTGAGVDINQQMVFEGAAALDPIMVDRATGSRLTADEESADGVVHLRNVSLAEGSYLQVDPQDQTRDELRLTVKLAETDPGGTNSAMMDVWDDAWSFDEIYGGASEAERKTLYVGHPSQWFYPRTWGTIGAGDTYLTYEQVSSGLDLMAGTQLGPNAILANRGVQGGFRDGHIHIYAGQDGNSGDYLGGGLIILAGNQDVSVRAQDSAAAGHPEISNQAGTILNVVHTPIRFANDFNNSNEDGWIDTNRDGADLAFGGVVQLDRVELEPGAWARLRPEDSFDLVVAELRVMGSGSAAVLDIEADQDHTLQIKNSDGSNDALYSAAPVGNAHIGNITGADPGNVLSIYSGGNQFDLRGTLGIDVVVTDGQNTRARLTEGFDLNGRTLTLGGRDHRIYTDPGTGTIVKNGADALDIDWGHNNLPSDPPLQ
ncbi:MAG: hypothetical protein ACE5K7_04395, partial [Phycisphaerae bacterium]